MGGGVASHKHYEFHFLRRGPALHYHLMFHHSSSLHVNHMIFLHSYLFGVLLCSSTNFISLVVVTTVFVLYAGLIIRPISCALIYDCIILCLAASAYVLDMHLSSEYDMPKWAVGICGVGLVLFSFTCQLIGHAMYEDLIAPPNLIHGFIAAPILEFQHFLFKWNLIDNSLYLSILEEVDRGRSELRGMLCDDK